MPSDAPDVPRLTPGDLRHVDALNDQPDDDLQWLIDTGEVRTYGPGDRPFERGDEAKEMVIIVQGEMEIYTFESGQREFYARFHAGSVSGLLPFSRMETYGGEGIVTAPSTILYVWDWMFPEMLNRMPELGTRLTAIMSDRVRETARMEQQQEKMMALGKLSAGLAHELNNPAAAVQRTSERLGELLATIPGFVAQMADCGIPSDAIQKADALKKEVLSRPREPLSTLARSEREDEIADWMDTVGRCDSGWRVAEAFADAGFTLDDLDALVDGIRPEARSTVLGWLHGSLTADQLLADVQSAASRITELVGAVKSYTHMDRAATPEPTDVHDGLEQTLTIMGSKLKDKSIRVVREFADDLPPVLGLAGALNQVWTNLIDNAIDAMDGGGTLTLRTERGAVGACVFVIDDGVGIPDDVQSRIFEPFFTTKDVGDGTGLGLDIVHRIVTRVHQGTLTVESEPGRTCFTVQLPAASPTSAPTSANNAVDVG